ncbi:hypothetical protein [Pseudomonas oryzihabitans]|uniref:hypothetical protein n=1 Tax=Pseudomonas oryzihabitans TaxID=47885 RepID=UPI0028942845|nr:hypothetical protein [Pseudomonas oryzihabitans]MDT3718582.1 hypothetical protein [Pseudomonas oryzihabitans]
MSVRLCALWLALITFTGSAHAEKLLLEGTLGKAVVVVDVDTAAGDEAYGRYFYDRYRRDLRLSGPAQSGDQLKLEEGAPWQDGPKASWSLTRGKDGRWTGIWSGDGKTLPIALAPLQLEPATALDGYRQKLRQDDPYEFRRLQGLKLEQGERQAFMGRELRWWREPVSGMRLFTVAGASETANAALRERLWAEVDAHLSCVGSDGDHSLTVTPQLLTERVLSVNLFSQYSCSGAAHPDFGSAPLTLDLKTGQELALEDFLWLGHGKPIRPVAEDRYSQVLADYRAKSLAPWVIRLFIRLYPELMQAPAPGDGCDYRSADVWQFAPWYLTPEGLYLGPTFFRAARNCDEPGGTLVPYAEVRKHPGPRVGLLPR